MNTFTLRLFAADRSEVVESVAGFTGEDASGSFGVLARHDRFATVLAFGVARVRFGDGRREFLGFPGGLLYFIDNELRISTRRYLRDTDVERIAAAIGRELLEEEQALAETRRRLHRLEAEMLRRLVRIEAE